MHIQKKSHLALYTAFDTQNLTEIKTCPTFQVPLGGSVAWDSLWLPACCGLRFCLRGSGYQHQYCSLLKQEKIKKKKHSLVRALQQTCYAVMSQSTLQLLSNSFVPESESMGVVGRLVGVEGLRHWLKKLWMCVDNSCLQEPSTSPRRISWTKSGSILWQKSVFTYSSKRVFHLHWDFGSVWVRVCKTITMDPQNTAWLQCTSHKGLVRSRASLRTPPLSNRAIDRFFNQSLFPPGCTNQSSELSSLCLDSEVTSILTMISCIKEQINPIRQCFLNLSRDPCTFCMSPLSNTPNSSHQVISRDCNLVRPTRKTHKVYSGGWSQGQLWEGMDRFMENFFFFLQRFFLISVISSFILNFCSLIWLLMV